MKGCGVLVLAAQRLLDLADKRRILRRHLAREVLDHLAAPVDQVLIKIPLGLVAGRLDQLGIQRIRIRTGHDRAGEHRELHAIRVVAEVGDLLRVRVFLLEVVGRETQHDETARRVFRVQLFQAVFLHTFTSVICV